MYAVGEIYLARNMINGLVYVGKTKQGFERRWRQHRTAAQKHPQTKLRLLQAIRKFGAESFVVELIGVATDEATLNEFEQMYIEEYKSNQKEFGYNMTTGGDGFGWGNQVRKGTTLTEEHKAAISEANKGKTSPGLAKAIRAWSGCKHTEETKEKMRRDRKGKKHGPMAESTKLKLSVANKGKKPPTTTIAAVIKALTGRKQSAATIAKRIESNRGKKRSPEYCQSLRERPVTDKQRQGGKSVGLSNRGRVQSEEEKEIRRIGAIKAQQRKTSEQRSAASRKAWEVRRIKYGSIGMKAKK